MKREGEGAAGVEGVVFIELPSHVVTRSSGEGEV